MGGLWFYCFGCVCVVVSFNQMMRCFFFILCYVWVMGFKKSKGEAPPPPAPKVVQVSSGESEQAAKRSLLEEERRRRGRASTLLASEAERQGAGGNGKRETLG